MESLMAGYSGTPLAKKLDIKPGSSVFVESAPIAYDQLLAPIPADVKVQTRYRLLDGHRASVRNLQGPSWPALKRSLQHLRPDAALWVSWPKKASKVPTDITEDTIRELAFPLGLVDIKVCAVDDIWSGLKLVVRLENRPDGKQGGKGGKKKGGSASAEH